MEVKVLSRGALGALLGLALFLPAPAARADIAARGPATTVGYRADSAKELTAGAPAGAKPGDLLVASLGFGASDARTQPLLSAPDGWELVSRTTESSIGALAVYRHVLAAGESSFTWRASVPVGGTAAIAAFSGVSRANPSTSRPGAPSARGRRPPRRPCRRPSPRRCSSPATRATARAAGPRGRHRAGCPSSPTSPALAPLTPAASTPRRRPPRARPGRGRRGRRTSRRGRSRS